MSFLRDTRLERVHAQLMQADPQGTSVTEVAFRAGFDHLSNFASLYRNRFGRLPSETLLKKPC
ncbi:DNA-binding transcriptional activator FeaR [compost metagenome]